MSGDDEMVDFFLGVNVQFIQNASAEAIQPLLDLIDAGEVTATTTAWGAEVIYEGRAPRHVLEPFH